MFTLATDLIDNRKNPRNMIVAGLWLSDQKPQMQTFFKPVVDELKDLESKGINYLLYSCNFNSCLKGQCVGIVYCS